jgi:putative mRNA 3-end processing factor
MNRKTLLELTDCGLYCEEGDFYVDPWKPVERAVITHAHGDHARPGMGSYLVAEPCVPVMRARFGEEIVLQHLPYGENLTLGDVKVSFHPAGHILGSAQVRLEKGGEVLVVSGDYKLESDPTCEAFGPVRCDVFVTESTFGLPIYRWKPQSEVFTEIGQWWRGNQEQGKASVLFDYSLGKSQRVLAGIDSMLGPIYAHGAIRSMNQAYRETGVSLPEAPNPAAFAKGHDWSRALILAPPSANGTPWMRRFGDVSTAFASGWMAIRGARRRRAVDRGFVLSDHADWQGLLTAVEATGAECVWVTHGYSAVLARYLSERGLEAEAIPTRFEGEMDVGGAEAEAELVEQAQI